MKPTRAMRGASPWGPALAAALLLGACASTKPQVIYQASGEATSYKRYERSAQRDFLHHFTRQAYSPPGWLFGVASEDQKTILEQWGKPAYVRRPFLSMEDERVREWVYLDQKRIFQFVNNRLVFEGPLTDLEQLFLRHGYPDGMTTTIDELGKVRSSLIYRPVFYPGPLDTYFLADGRIVHGSVSN